MRIGFAAVLAVVALFGQSGCDRETRLELKALVIDDCESALRLFDPVLSLRSIDEAKEVLTEVGVPYTEADLASVEEAQIFLLEQSIACGCTIRTRADYILGRIHMIEGRYQEAEPFLRVAVEMRPTREAVSDLVFVLEMLNRDLEAKEVRERYMVRGTSSEGSSRAE